MELNEIKNPQFVKNDKGMISVFLPAFKGEPENPVLTKKDETTLHFQFNTKGDIDLTEIPEEVMTDLASVSKILVVEINAMKSMDILEKSIDALTKNKEPSADTNIMDAVQRAYEVSVKA